MAKKILVLFLALALAISMFACGKEDETEPPVEENGSQGTETGAAPDGYEGETGDGNSNTGDETSTTDDGSEDDSESATEFVPVEVDPYDYMANDLTDFIQLGEYRGLSVTKVSSTVTDEMFDEAIDELLNEYSYYNQITDRAVADGDDIVVDYSGYLDGVQFSGGTATETELTASADSGYIEGFAEAFIGKMPGEEFEFDITFPEDYHNEEMAGAYVTFKCKVHYILDSELIVPEINDEFVSENFGYSNAEEFLIAFRRSVEREYEYSANAEMYQSLWTEVVGVATIIEYPGQEVERLYTEMRLWYEDYAEYYGTDYETFINSYLGYTDEDLMNLAKDYVKEDLVMYQLIKENNIELTDEEYEEGAQFYADLYSVTVDELIEYYGEERIKNTLLWEKLMADILEDSVIVE